MGQLRIKDIEGEAHDIQKLFHEGEYDLSSYIGAGRKWKRISNFWIWGASFVFFILSSCIWINLFDNAWHKVATLGAFLLGFLITGMVQYNFRNRMLTAIAVVAALAIILIALEVYSPQEVIRKIEKVTTKEMDKK